MRNFAKLALQNGGSIFPLIIPASLTGGTGLMNPSVFNDGGKIYVIIRHVNYTFYHSEAKVFLHPWGPLTYLHPENDMHLRTHNYFCAMNDAMEIEKFFKIDMSALDVEPKWEFVGLEDVRLVKWDGKFYITGVRRDTTTNGEGRMELSEIIIGPDFVKEVTRFRIPPPVDKESYCEKNWMPVLDLPFHYVKWCTPTEVVKVDTVAKTCQSLSVTPHLSTLPRDVRGGSQVITIGDYYLALTHEVDLFKSQVGRKDAVYHHRFIVWDKNWNMLAHSPTFFFMDAQVEFSVGMCRYGAKEIIVTFGFQDNAAFLLKFPLKIIEDFLQFSLEPSSPPR